MTSRDHPFNRSTRPLLMERKPQLLLKKNKGDPKVHGFNDFDDIMSQQYKVFNTHIGYPYGSPPPSPTVNSNDFVFSDNTMSSSVYGSTPNTNCSNNKTTIRTTAATPATAIKTTYHHGPEGGRRGGGGGYAAALDHFQNNNEDTRSWSSKMSSKFDDFGWTKHQANIRPIFNERDSSGPFIFGVHNANGNYRGERNTTTVINSTKTYSSMENGQKLALNQSNSDTSSSSQNTENDSNLLVKGRKAKRNCKDKKNGKENRPKIKCVLVGDGAVGKTSLIVTYLENRFEREHVPTASDIYNAEVMVNDSPVHLTLCDTAGQDTLDPLRELCYPDSDVFLLCFSVVKPETFRSIKTKWAPKFTKTKAALILVGTQIDLRMDPHVLNKLQIEGEKPISFTDAWDLATSIGAKYVETSSFTQEKVKDVFDTAIWDALLPNHLPPTPPFWKKLFCLA